MTGIIEKLVGPVEIVEISQQNKTKLLCTRTGRSVYIP